jgi:hypothetical protein
MSFEVVLSDLRSIYGVYLLPTDQPYPKIRLKEKDVQRWSTLSGVPRSTLYDQIAIHLARAFYESELTFAFCDWILNDIHGIITTNDEARPELFWKVYLAFDEGEFYHTDKRDEDPAEVYTRPMVAKILAGSSR